MNTSRAQCEGDIIFYTLLGGRRQAFWRSEGTVRGLALLNAIQ